MIGTALLAAGSLAAGPPRFPDHCRKTCPKPFNPQTTFAFELRDADSVELVDLDRRGGLVRTLIDGACSVGRTEVAWRGDDDEGRAVASGTCVYLLRAAGLQYRRTATLVK